MNAISIEQGETEPITGRAEGEVPYLLEINGATVRLGKSVSRTESQGQQFYPADRPRITLHQGETLYAYAVDGDAEIEARVEGFDVDLFPRRNVYEIQEVGSIESVGNLANHDTVQSLTHDPNSDGSLPNAEVPPGIEVVVQASLENASDSYVTVGQHELGPGDSISLRVTDPAEIPVEAATDGDVVNLTWEA